VSLIGPAFSDRALLALAQRFADGAPTSSTEAPGCVLVAVAGAHLRGQPLNHELTARGARFVGTRCTAADYRLFALKNDVLEKPGLLRDPGFAGNGIDVEVWAMPENQFGGFVADVPPPLTIGNVALHDGSLVKGFLCEGEAALRSVEITSFGGWRTYLESRA